MKGTHYDVPKHNFDAASIVQTVASKALHAAADNVDIAITTDTINTKLTFLVLFIAVTAAVFIRPQIYCAREFYKACFKEKCWYRSPPRKWVFDLIWFFVDALSIGAIVEYLWNHANPIDGNPETYYVSIFALFFSYLGFRWFWINAFWNYHNKKSFVGPDIEYSWEVSTALGFAILFILLAWVALVVDIFLLAFAPQHDYLAMGLLILPVIWVTLLAIWTIMVYNCLPKACGAKKPVCNLKNQKRQQLV